MSSDNEDFDRMLRASQDHYRRLKAAWGGARFVTWEKFIKYFEPNSKNYSPAVIAQIDRIFEKVDVNSMIEQRIAALGRGDTMEASRIRGELLAVGVELNDVVAAISRSVQTKWEVLPAPSDEDAYKGVQGP